MKSERTFYFKVSFGEGKEANGLYEVEALSEIEAQDRALEEICSKLYHALPELDIEVTVEAVNEDENTF